ncbi:hypothetical protein ABZV14_26110 [Streptosporangium canum]|uniref:hypothetical protein n=1 Tax=Streptosporangium canum TaxID=324952 RepID=UPI0033AF2265
MSCYSRSASWDSTRSSRSDNSRSVARISVRSSEVGWGRGDVLADEDALALLADDQPFGS